MYIIVDERDLVAGGYASGLDREGVSTAGIDPGEFQEWIGKVSDTDMCAVEAFLIGDCGDREDSPQAHPRALRKLRCSALTIASRSTRRSNCSPPASTTCVRKPVHVREILARVGAISRRVLGEQGPRDASASCASISTGANPK